MSDDQPNVVRVTAHTGAEFEAGAVHRARGVNEAMPGVEVEAAGVDEGNQCAGGHDNFRPVDGRQKRLRPTPASKKLTVLQGDKASEDDRWVHILEIKANGTKVYLCVACGKEFTGAEDKIIAHKLQLGGLCAACPRAPSAECRLVLEKIKNAKNAKHAAGQRLTSAAPVTSKAVANSGAIGGALFGNPTARSEAVDAALACWCVGHDVAWAAVDSRDTLWRDLIAAIRLPPAWVPPPREVLSADHDRGAEVRAPSRLRLRRAHSPSLRERLWQARAGGLYLALQGCRKGEGQDPQRGGTGGRHCCQRWCQA
eukprot:7380750-Prymnesium_polylepis.1